MLAYYCIIYHKAYYFCSIVMMVGEKEEKNMKSIIKATVVTIIYFLIAGYLALPAFTFRSPGFIIYLLIGLGIWIGAYLFFIMDDISSDTKIAKVFGGFAVLLSLTLLVGWLTSCAFFRSNALSHLIGITTVDFGTTITPSEEVTDIALMDTQTAEMFGERALGELSDLVSVYDVEKHYTTICYQGKPQKVAPLGYDNVFKYFSHKELGIPGYVMVDPVGNTAKYIAVEKPINYAPSAYFGKNLKRHLRAYSLTKLYGDSFFELDEEGNVFFVTPVYTPAVGLFGGKIVTSVVITDAVTGENTEYAMANVPEWVDIVIDGDTVCKYYNWYGKLRNGFWNSVLSQNGCFMTTDDFGYKVIGNDVYIYTGVTSCNNSTSATGFILCNSRTGEMCFMSVTGAEEHSAMAAAEGEVSDYGWVASFPSIINVNGEPVYLMVLKDSNNIVKRYAMVNIKSYNIVAIAETQKKVLAKYNALINGEDEASAEAAAETMIELEVPETAVEKTVTIKEIQYIVVNGNTTVYVTTTDGVYRAQFDEKWILVHAGDSVAVTVSPAESGEIGQIYNIK